MKCVNCGAELHNSKCEYCGSDYSRNKNISGEIDKYSGYVNIGGKEFHVYLADVEVRTDVSECLEIDMSKKIVVERKRKFTLVEY